MSMETWVVCETSQRLGLRIRTPGFTAREPREPATYRDLKSHARSIDMVCAEYSVRRVNNRYTI